MSSRELSRIAAVTMQPLILWTKSFCMAFFRNLWKLLSFATSRYYLWSITRWLAISMTWFLGICSNKRTCVQLCGSSFPASGMDGWGFGVAVLSDDCWLAQSIIADCVHFSHICCLVWTVSLTIWKAWFHLFPSSPKQPLSQGGLPCDHYTLSSLMCWETVTC